MDSGGPPLVALHPAAAIIGRRWALPVADTAIRQPLGRAAVATMGHPGCSVGDTTGRQVPPAVDITGHQAAHPAGTGTSNGSRVPPPFFEALSRDGDAPARLNRLFFGPVVLGSQNW